MLDRVKAKKDSAARDGWLKRGSLLLAGNRVIDSLLAGSVKLAPRSLMYLSTIKGRSILSQVLTSHPELMAPYFDRVRCFALFLSMARSGHSIMAHLLTAHPKVLICDELAAISYFEAGYSKEQVFSLIKFQDYIYICDRRRKSGYNYLVDGVWQNEFNKHPEVIGDAKGARSVRLFGAENGDFLDKLRRQLDMPLRVIVHLRNPFDSISTRSRKRGIKLHRAVRAFVEKERMMTVAFERLSEEERLVQRHEDVIENPESSFIRMFQFVGIEPMPEVVKACAEKIWKKPNVTRKQVDWPQGEIDILKDCLRRSPLFHSYREE